MDHTDLAPPSVPFACLPQAFQLKRRDLSGRGVELKSVECEFKADVTKRRFEGFFSSYGNVDLGNDLIEPYAGAQYLKRDWERHLIKTFWNHEVPCGPRPEVLEEHKEGLFAVCSMTDHPSFDLYLKQLEDGTARHGSIGWINRGSERVTIDGKSVRKVKSYRVVEVSPVYYPMNEQTSVALAKAYGALAEGVESKGLYGMAEAIYALANARSCLEYVSRLMNPEPTLTEEERAIVDRLYQETAAMSETAGAMYLASRKGLPEETPPEEAPLFPTPEQMKSIITAAFAERKSGSFVIPNAS